MHSKLLQLLILTLCADLAFTHTLDHEHISCGHQKFKHTPEIIHIDEQPLQTQGRYLATTTTYSNIRITVDYSNLLVGTTDFKAYVQTELIPAVVDYFQAALGVKQPLISPLKVSTSSKTICGYTTPKALFTGVETDFYVIVSSTTDTTSNWVASAGSCSLSSVTKRPIIAQMLFNTYYTVAPNGNALTHEKNMYLTMHEMIHALGFSGSSFANFIDDAGKTLTGHIKTVLLDGTNRTVLDVDPLTSKLRAHYGCPTLPGAFLEDDGGSGTAGSHFERRHFLYEAMTSGVIQGLRLSEFSLALLEGSGWYMPNYTYADPFFVGQGEGCGFISTSCSSTSILNYDEFCSGSGRGCAAVGTGGGVCSTDTRSDGCSYYIPPIQYSCESDDAVSYARFPKLESFGRAAGSKCFSGNLSTSSKSTQSSFCFKYSCSGSGLSTTLQVLIGTLTATCNTQGSLSVKGYYGQIDCPDPLTFCNTIGKKRCPRNCMGRGTCVNNQCVCKSGYTGTDCAMNA